jgi:hypothetical protein
MFSQKYSLLVEGAWSLVIKNIQKEPGNGKS